MYERVNIDTKQVPKFPLTLLLCTICYILYIMQATLFYNLSAIHVVTLALRW